MYVDYDVNYLCVCHCYSKYISFLYVSHWSTDFLAAWKVIKTWLSAEALTKTKFVTKSDIQAYIGKDELLEHMGGSVCQCIFCFIV